MISINSIRNKVNNNLRTLFTFPLTAFFAVAFLSVAVPSQAKTIAHVLDLNHVEDVVLHDVGHAPDVPDVIGVDGVSRVNNEVKAVRHVEFVGSAVHLNHVDDVLSVAPVNQVRQVVGAGLVLHAGEVHHVRSDSVVPSTLHVENATHLSRVLNVSRVGFDGDRDVNSVSNVFDTNYVRSATGIYIYGNAGEWHTLAARYGYYVSDRPVPGGAVSFEGGAYGASNAYGFVGVVVYYHDRGDYWEVGTRYAHKAEGASYYNGSYVKEQAFRVKKNDARAHYIYRSGTNVRPGGYYTRPEYFGHSVVGKQYAFSTQTEEVVVYQPDVYTKATVGPNQVVRVLAKAEAGETIWVFVETPYRAGNVYARTYHEGKEHLRRFDVSSPDASHMYYAKNYGDTVLDLGYADYSEIAGDSREVTITIKKGSHPARLQILQVVRLQLAGK